MKKTLFMLCCAAMVCAEQVVRAEIADPIYRDGIIYNINEHAALVYRYDHGNAETYVLHSAGGGSHEANSVRVGNWSEFLGSGKYTGKRSKSISKGVRQAILSDALDQLNAFYWGYGPFTYCWMTPNSAPASGDGCFRCDGLVEWCYEQNGQDLCNDAALFPGGPKYQREHLPAENDAPPTGAAMTFPDSTNATACTVASSLSLYLTSVANDVHSGLSYNRPFEYFMSCWTNGAWTAWASLGKDGVTHHFSAMDDTYYAFYVRACDNDAELADSSIYYLYAPASVEPPGNDAFDSPVPLLGLPANASGANMHATLEPNEPIPALWVGYADASVWFRWTAPTSGPVRIDTLGSDFDTLLAVWSGETLEDLTLLANNDQYNMGDQSAVFFEAETGVTYRISVYGWGDGTGDVMLNITNDMSSRISGTVTGPDGVNALAAIQARVYCWNESWESWGLVGESETDVDGHYTIRGLPAGTYRVEFTDAAGDYLSAAYDDAADLDLGIDVVVPAETVVSGIDLSLAPASKIAGTVTGSGGMRPLQGVEASACRWDESGEIWVSKGRINTAADGQYMIGGLQAGTYRVQFTDWNGDYVREVYDGATNLAAGTDIVVPADTIVRGIDAALAGASIAGTVTGPGGNPLLQGIEAVAYRWSETWGYWEWMGAAQTDATGHYAIEGLPSGIYRVQFTDGSGDYLEEFYNNAVALETGADIIVSAKTMVAGIDVSLANASKIAGTVTGPGEIAPLKGIEAAAYRWNGSWEYWEWMGGVQTDVGGHYTIGGLPAGTFRVQFTDWNGEYKQEVYNDAAELASGADLIVSDESTLANVDASLASASKIVGTVTGPSGIQPLRGIEATVYRFDEASEEWGWIGGVQTDSDGNYAVNGLPAGTYRILFADGSGYYVSEGYSDAPDLESATDIVVPAETTVSGIDVSLARTSPDPPSIVGVKAGTNGWELQFVGNIGEEYAVQETTALTNSWSNVGVSVQCGSGTNAIPLPPSAPNKFLRLRRTP